MEKKAGHGERAYLDWLFLNSEGGIPYFDLNTVEK